MVALNKELLLFSKQGKDNFQRKDLSVLSECFFHLHKQSAEFSGVMEQLMALSNLAIQGPHEKADTAKSFRNHP